MSGLPAPRLSSINAGVLHDESSNPFVVQVALTWPVGMRTLAGLLLVMKDVTVTF